jgi:hypothetical protein
VCRHPDSLVISHSNENCALYLDVFAPTLEEVATVQAGVDYDALTKAIESVKSTVRPSGRHQVDSKRVYANKAAQLEKAAEPK